MFYPLSSKNKQHHIMNARVIDTEVQFKSTLTTLSEIQCSKYEKQMYNAPK